jgi:hypothetical protein
MYRYANLLVSAVPWLAVAFLVAGPSVAAAGDLKVSLSPGYTRGDYGSSISTETYEVPLKVSYQEGPYRISVRIPYLGVTGPQTAVPNIGVVGSPSNGSRRGRDVVRSGSSGSGGPGPSGGSGSGSGSSGSSGSGGSGTDDGSAGSSGIATSANSRSTVQGLGDLGLAGSARVLGGQKGDWFKLELGAGTKLPTGDKGRGLGTGQVGLSTQMLATIDFPRDLTLEFTFGRFFRTAHSSDLRLEDYFYSTTSLSYDITPKLTVGLSLDVQERAVTDGTAVVEAGLFMEYEILHGTRVGANVFHGFTRDSSAFGAGLMVSHKFSL